MVSSFASAKTWTGSLAALTVLHFTIPMSPAEPPTTPPDSGIVEHVEVREIQVQVTAWPKDGDPARCRTLRKEDFILDVDGAPTPIVSFLSMGETVPVIPMEGIPPEEPTQTPLSIVVLIDEYHHSCPMCALRARCCGGGETVTPGAIMRHRVYESARQMLRETFRPGDRVLISTFVFWPIAETGWLEDPAEALEKLDQLERDMRWVREHQAGTHMRNWYDGMMSFFRALGSVDGPKEILFPTCHFPLTADDAEEIRALGAVALENNAVLHTVDVTSCSLIPGEFGCEPYEFIGPLAANLGGVRFSAGQGSAGAVQTLRTMTGCQFLLSFKPPQTKRGNIGHSVSVSTYRRKEFDLRAPPTFFDAYAKAHTWDLREAMVLLPEFHQGYGTDVVLWPVRPGKKGEWEALALIRIERVQNGEDMPGPPEELVVDVLAWPEGQNPAVRQFRLKGQLLAGLLSGTERKGFAVPMHVKQGVNDFSVIVRDPGSRDGAVIRRRFVVPPTPRENPGEWWVPASGAARVEGKIIPVPKENNRFRVGETPRLLGMACGSGPGPEPRFIEEKSGLTAPARIFSFSPPGPYLAPPEGCRWQIAEPLAPLAVGRWTLGFSAPVIEIIPDIR